MFVVRLMVEQAEAGSIFPLAMLAHSARGDPRVHKCVARTIVRLILDYMKFAKFRNRGFLISWRGFLRFCSTTLASFQSTPYHMKPQRERSDGAGLGRLGGLSSSFRAPRKQGLLPVSDDCCMVHQGS